MNGRILFSVLLLITELSFGNFTPCPDVLPRNRWGGRPARNPDRLQPLSLAQYVVVHQTATPHCVNHASCAGVVRGIQNAHFIHKNYNDIGYHFLIGGNGLIYEGRGWRIQGELSPNFNTRALSIALIGNFDNVLPDIRALNAFQALVTCGYNRQYLHRNFKYVGHRQINTNTICPGKALMRYMVTWPRFEFNPRITFKNSTLV